MKSKLTSDDIEKAKRDGGRDYGLGDVIFSYELLIKIVELYFKQFPQISNELNYYYENFVRLILDGIRVCKYQHEFENNENYELEGILYFPFTNLYLAQSELTTTNLTPEQVINNMNVCYGQILTKRKNNAAGFIKSKYFSTLLNGLNEYVNRSETSKTKLIFNLSTGKATVVGQSDSTYEAIFRSATNTYRLLVYLIQNPGIKSFAELAKCFKESDKSTDERRVRDAVKEIKDKLKLETVDNIFVTDYGFGLSCDIEIKQ